MLFVGRKAPIQSGSVQSVTTGPPIEAEGSWGLVITTPHPTEAGSREAESSVYKTMSGNEKRIWPRVVGDILLSLFTRFESLLVSGM